MVWWAQTCSYFHNRTLEAIGRCSYSIYLWHMPVALFWCLLGPSFLGVLGDIVSSVIVGVMMVLIIENPVLRLREKFFPRRSRDTEYNVRESSRVLQQALPVR